MESTLAGTTSTLQPAPKKSRKSRPNLQLVELRQQSRLTIDCYWARLNAQKKLVTLTEGLGRNRIGIQIKSPNEFFDLDSLERDCLLKANAGYCPGSAGTISHTYLGIRETLCLDTSHPEDVKRLVFNHRLSDLDPSPVTAA